MKRNPGRQTGAALLALIFVVVIASTYVLMLRLNATTRPYLREQRSVSGLQEAKQALIAYALTYPEQPTVTDLTAGPGHLPCPDTDNDGSPDQPCGPLSDIVELGRLPGEYLDVAGYEDSSGERLWYAVSGKFKNNPKTQPMNSDTPGQLTVDGVTDVVAVIIAPGPPTEDQVDRPSSTVAHYLEGENADGDAVFSANSGNDRLVYITRQELMSVVEKRVLGDFAVMLRNYNEDVGVYPWLTNFDPLAADADHDPIVNVKEGYIAFNEQNEVFPTQFSVSWDVADGPPFTMTPSAVMPDWNNFPPITVDQATPFSVTGSPECTWTEKEAINCNGRFTEPLPPRTIGLWIQKGTGTRTYDFTVMLPPGGTLSVPNGTNAVRTRGVSVQALAPTDFPLGTSASVTITDTGTYDTICLVLLPLMCLPLLPTESPLPPSDTNNITTSTDGTIAITGVTYDLGVEDEVPQWVIANDWHKLIQVAYSAGDVPDYAAACIPSGSPACLTVTGAGTPTDNKRALVVAAGSDLSSNRPSSADIADYFEEENASPGDEAFEKAAYSTNFNDQVRVIATSP